MTHKTIRRKKRKQTRTCYSIHRNTYIEKQQPMKVDLCKNLYPSNPKKHGPTIYVKKNGNYTGLTKNFLKYYDGRDIFTDDLW